MLLCVEPGKGVVDKMIILYILAAFSLLGVGYFVRGKTDDMKAHDEGMEAWLHGYDIGYNIGYGEGLGGQNKGA
jgi:hypothetical protein